MGRQSAAGKAIDAFIKELRHKELPASVRTTAASLVKQAYKRYEETGFVHTDVYENALRQIALQCGFKLLQDIKKKIFYITPKDDQRQRLITSSSIGGIVEFLSSQPLLSPEATKPWKVGDKCRVTMPSGVVIDDGVIASIQPSRGTCKISVAETGSHFSAELASLTRV
ncbi:tudor domain-containing protein [Nostoc sp.]